MLMWKRYVFVSVLFLLTGWYESLGDTHGPYGQYPFKSEDGQMEALIDAVLHLEDDCLYLKTTTEKVVPVFPQDLARWEPKKQTLFYLGQYFQIGDRLKVNGGFVKAAQLNTLFQDIPKSCKSDEVFIVGTQLL